MNSLRRLWSIALVEWKLQVRAIAFWVSLAILLLYTLGQVIGSPDEMAFLTRQWLGGREDSLTWLAIGLIFLVPSALARDRRTGAFIWTTLTTSGVYATGKLIGTWLTALTLAGVELVGQGLMRLPSWERLTLEVLTMILGSLWGWLVGILYITSVYFLLTALANSRALLAYALNSVYYVAIFSVKDIANPLSFVPFAVFRSDLVGDGPESLLFRAHHMFYLGLTLVMSMLALFVYSWRERRGLFPKFEQSILLSGLVFSLGVAGWTGKEFIQARTDVVTLRRASAYTPPPLAAESVQLVRVAARVDPTQGHVEGSIKLTLMQPMENIVFDIPAGLRLAAVTDCHDQALQTTYLDERWAQVAPTTPQMCVTFDGTWRLNRSSYQRRGHIRPEELDLNAGVYIGEGYMYLTPGARWYPAPVGPYEWQVGHEVEISLPREISAVSSGTFAILEDGERIIYHWKNSRGKPWFILVAGDYLEVPMPNGDLIWAAPEHSHVAEQASTFYMGFLKPIDRLLGKDHSSYQIVETPVLRWPLVLGQFVLLPERYFIERLSPALPTDYETYIGFIGPQKAFQREMYYTVRGWLQGQAFFSDPSLAMIYGFSETPNSPADPLAGYVPLRECLAYYLAMQVADQQFGTHILDGMIAERIKYAEKHVADPTQQQGPVALTDTPIHPVEYNWAFNQMFAALGRLERRVGREQVNQMIGRLVELHAGSTITVTDWLWIVGELSGPEARHEFEATYPVQSSQTP